MTDGLVRIPGGLRVRCRVADAVEGSLWCEPCDLFIHGKAEPCLRCGDLPQIDGRPWCVRCGLEIDTFDKTETRGVEDL